MVQFPETVMSEWQVAADAANAEADLRKRIARARAVEDDLERLRVRHAANLAHQQELEAEQTPELEMLTLKDYKNNPSAAPVDLIDGVMKANGLTLFLGPSGSGKSTLALQALYCLMTGDDFLGETTKPIMGSVGVLSYDMDAPMVLDWMSGYPNVDSDKISVVNAYKRGNPIGVASMRAKIAAEWQRIGVEIVVVDSFSASFFGNDQNDAATTMAHYRDLIKFALTECGAKGLIVIAHSTESNTHKVRGSTVHHDVADSILVVEGTGTATRKVEMVKYRAALGQTMMTPRMITAPDSVTHLVDLDSGAMSLEGMRLPASVAAAAFPDLPESNEEPDTESDDEEDDDL